MLDNNLHTICNTESTKNVVCWGIGLGCDDSNNIWRPLQVINNNLLKYSCIDISSILQYDISINIDNTHMGNVGLSYYKYAFNHAPYVLQSNIIFADNKHTYIKSNTNISGGLFNIVNQHKPVTISGLTISDVSFIKPLITILDNASVIINNLNISNCTFTERGKLLDISNSNVTLMNINISECTSTGFESLISYNSDNLNNNLTLTKVNINNIDYGDNANIIELSGIDHINELDVTISHCKSKTGIYSHNDISFSNAQGHFINNNNITVLNIDGDLTLNEGIYKFLNNSCIALSDSTSRKACFSLKPDLHDTWCNNHCISPNNPAEASTCHSLCICTNVPRGGGTISAKNINIIDASMTFSNNYVSDYAAAWLHGAAGGALYASNDLTIIGNNTKLQFLDNSSIYGAGAICVSNNIAISTNGYIDFCGNSGYRGGALLAGKNISLIDTSMTFRNNSAHKDGGAIYSSNYLTINGNNTKLQFLDNFGHSGGAIHAHEGLTINTNGNGFIDFCGNNSVAAGGAIYSLGNVNFIDTNITFNKNYTENNGGAIYMGSPSTLIFNGGNYYFLENSSNSMGAAIKVSNIIIDNSSIITRLDFIKNQGNNIVSFDRFDSSRACPFNYVPVEQYGCSNIYNFISNTYTAPDSNNTVSLIYYTNKFFMGGGYWNFSDNTYIIGGESSSNYTLLQQRTSSKISIRRSDISFGELDIRDCKELYNVDVSSAGGYYAYTIRSFSEAVKGQFCPGEIFKNKYN